MKKSYLIISIFVALFLISGFFIYRYSQETAAFQEGVQITVDEVTPEEVRVTYSKLQLHISIYNPTDETINDFSAEYDVFIANTQVGSGSISDVFLPAKTTQTSTSSIIIYYAQVADAVVDALTSQKYDLTVKGTFQGRIFFNLLSISEEFSAMYRA